VCSNYEPVTDSARLLAAFGVSLPAGAEPAAYTSAGLLAPFIVRSKVRVPDILGDAKMGILGLLPDFATTVEFAKGTYNCRTETMRVKPTFKASWFAGRRCVIPVQQLSEWCYETESGNPELWGVRRADAEPMGLAGLWNEWLSPTGERVLSFSMLTINADGHEVFGHLNHPDHEKRMPVILPTQAAQEAWLYETARNAELLLVRFPADQLHAGALEAKALPLKEPPSWVNEPDMFEEEWRTTAAETPRKRGTKARAALPPPPPETPGPTTGDLFG
jgi:putative SOS response-associated peptidase YedK